MSEPLTTEALRSDIAEMLYQDPEEVNQQENLFAAGLDSVRLLNLVERWRASGFQVSFVELAADPTLEAWAKLLRPGGQGARTPDVRHDEFWPLSVAQEGIWTGQQLDPDSTAYNTAEYVEVLGPLDETAFVTAVRTVVGEVDALNVEYVAGPDGSPTLHLGQCPEWTVQVKDLREQPDPLGTARQWMADDVAKPVDLSRDPVFGHALLRIGEAHFLWYHRVHHIALDGYGFALVSRRVAAVYTALVTGEQVTPTEFDSLLAVLEEDRAYQDSDQRAKDQEYWTQRFADRPEPAVLTTRSAPQSRSFLRSITELDEPIMRAVRTVAAQAKATWPDVLIAASVAFWLRMTDAAEVIFGLPVMGRLGSVSLQVPSMVLNIVPLRVAASPEATLTDLTRSIASMIKADRPHHRYRYEHLRQDLGLTGGRGRLYGPAINVMPFDYDLDFAGHRGIAHNISAGPVEDIAINIYDRADGTGLRIALDANPECYTSEEVAGYLRRFVTFLAAAADPAGRPYGEIDLLVEGERKLLLEDRNSTARELPETTVVRLFAQQVDRTPEATALVFGDTELTYLDLATQVNRLARLLIHAGAGPGGYVALLLPRTADAIVALLAVLTAGAAYIPIDPDQPASRIAGMLDDARPAIVLTTRAAAAAPTIPGGTRPILLDDPKVVAALARCAEHEVSNDERLAPLSVDTAAYLLYTSGSTGRPKGVIVEHLSLSNLYQHHQTELFESATAAAGAGRFRAALTAALSFDTSWEGLLCMIAGHELHLVDDDTRRDAAEAVRYIREHQIDFLDITPSYAEELRHAGLLAEGAHHPAVIALGGEAAGQALWTALRDRPHITGHNLYGPTECTVDALHCRLDESPTPMVGRPLANTRAYVLDSRQRLLPPGTPGELYLAGALLARGYHDLPELTGQRFVRDPFRRTGERMYRTGDRMRWTREGMLEFLGRVDNQVKIRGFRVELGEVEAVLARHDEVGQVAVIAREDTPGTPRLVAYVVATPAAARDQAALRRYVGEHLPTHMVPTAVVWLDHLPVNANGKLDRRALPAPDFAAAVSGTPPRTARERELCAVFADVLGLPSVGVDDDFFELGGHSLLATRVISRIRERLGERISARAMFTHPTVAQLAALDPTAPVAHSTANPAGTMTPPALPAATGSYSIGATELHLIDRSRSDPWVPDSGPRELMVSVFYPALPSGGTARQYLTTQEAALVLKGLDITGIPPEVVSAVRSGARLGAPPIPRRHQFGLVVLSPGHGLPRSTLTGLAEDLASRGYVVAAIGHDYESYGTEFPDGHVTTRVADDAQDVDVMPKVRAADVSFLLDQLTGPKPAWADAWMIDPARIGMAGHSIGGNAAAQTMLTDPRVRAGVNMDGGFFAPIPTSGLDRPFLLLGTENTHTPDGLKGPEGADSSWQRDWPHLTNWKRWLTVTGSGHAGFTDLVVLDDQLGISVPFGTIGGVRSLELTRVYVGAFFDLHLGACPQPLLDGPTAANPEVKFWS